MEMVKKRSVNDCGFFVSLVIKSSLMLLLLWIPAVVGLMDRKKRKAR